jgi:hypothetical protein
MLFLPVIYRDGAAKIPETGLPRDAFRGSRLQIAPLHEVLVFRGGGHTESKTGTPLHKFNVSQIGAHGDRQGSGIGFFFGKDAKGAEKWRQKDAKFGGPFIHSLRIVRVPLSTD